MIILQSYSCKNCGAELFWNPKTNSLKCEFCDNEYQPSDFQDNTLNKNQKNEELQAEYTMAGQDLADGMVVYACKNCGGEVVTSKTTMATSCAFCGEAISITSKSAGNFRPEILIPFSINKKDAQKKYKDYVSSSFLTPKEFKEANKIEKMQGLYVPYWLHSMDTAVDSVMECEVVTSRRSGDDKIETHKVYHVYVDADGRYTNVPTDASKKLDDKLMDSLEPFRYEKLNQFNPAFMAGFYSEQPDTTKEETLPRAQERVRSSMQEKITATVNTTGNYNNKKFISFNQRYGNIRCNYAMLPIWLLNVKHKDKNYTFSINGDTGKAVGKLPMSISKLLLVAGGTALATQVAMMILRIIGIL